MRITTPEQLAGARTAALETLHGRATTLFVGMATCGLAAGSQGVFDALRDAAKERRLDLRVMETGCTGACYLEPLVDVLMPGQARVTYSRLQVRDVEPLLDAVAAGKVYEKRAAGRLEAEPFLLRGADESYGTGTAAADVLKVTPYGAHPFFGRQLHIATRNCGYIDPSSVEEYLAKDGYQAAAKALCTMAPDEIIAEITRSGLRGRGGGGFPTGRKWATCRKAPGTPKYVICNADEGDPGAYMDRSIIEGDPHSVLEGLIIGSFAIGAHDGYIYVRDEYPLAVQRLRLAIRQAEEWGFLGDNIFGSGHNFRVRINRGAGAFVCGESTALMASLEGRVGEPRAKYIHTVENGLWGKPSCLNNVETWNTVPAIILRGAPWFAAIGTPGSKGTKVFSLVGKISRVGLVEVPIGTTLREIIEEVGGGIPDGRRFKAVQTGGPSGGCIPAQHLDAPVDYESLTALGSMMGSGGMIVMDDRTCMVDVARYFLSFLREESCGKCVPCREGITRMLDILNGICSGQGKTGDIELLREIAQVTADASLCALGGSAPNPVLSTLKYFADEYRAHIDEHRCPAGVCKPLITYRIRPDKCTGCGACVKPCPKNVISGKRKQVHVIDTSGCIKCGACVDACKFDAVEVI